MSAMVEHATQAQTRQLIFEAKGGMLTDEESNALEQYLAFSVKLCIGSVDGDMCCAWGLIPPSLLSNTAYLWLFSTDAVEDHKFLFIRHSQIEVKKMLEEWPVITGYCQASNQRSKRWLTWLGASFGESGRQDFLPFTIRSK